MHTRIASLMRDRRASLCAAASLAMLVGLQVPSAGDARAAIDGCRRGGDGTTAIASCSEVIATSRDPRALERAYNLRGLAYEAAGQFQAAADDASEVIRRDPKVAGFFDNRARAYRGLGRPDLAPKDADAAVRMAPGYAFVFHGRGAVYVDLGRSDLAVRDFGTALSFNPADASLLIDRGRALATLDRPEEAVADFTAALAVRPTDAGALRERGLSRRRLGEDDGARADLIAALSSGLQDDVAAEALRQMDASKAPAADPTAEAGPAVAQLTPNQQFEQESRRRLQDEQEAIAARARAETKLKAERLSHAVEDARRALKDAADFVALNLDDSVLEDHLRRVRRLKSTAEGANSELIVSETQDLRAGLGADPVYAAYKARTDASNRQAELQTLDDVLRTLRIQRTFLIDAAARDALSPAAGDFITLAGQIPGVQANPDLGRAEALMGEIDAAIDKAGLTRSYALFQRTGTSAAMSSGPDHVNADGARGVVPAR